MSNTEERETMNTTTTRHSGVSITRVAKGHYTITTISGNVHSFGLLRDAHSFIFRNWYSILAG